MTTIEIPEINFKREFPSSYDEMTGADYLRFVKLYERVKAGNIDIFQLKVEMVYHFLNLRHNKFAYNHLPENDRLNININIFELTEHLDFLFEKVEIDGEVNLKVNLSWTKNHIPEYRNMVGPADLLADITWIEYKDALMCATSFVETQDIQHLHQLAAVLYRKRGFWRNRKKTYNPDKALDNIKNVKHWPFHVLYGIFLFFLSCEKYIREGTFNIDNQEITFSILFKQGEDDNSGPGAGLTGLLYNLAETGVFGNAKETAKQNLFDILFRLWQVKTDYEHQKNKQKKKS